MAESTNTTHKELRAVHGGTTSRRALPGGGDASPAGGTPQAATPFTLDNLLWAAQQCLRGCGWKDGTARFRRNLLGNCRRLEQELATGKYRMAKPNLFEITSPKRRTVNSLLLRDRIVHKVICHQGGLTRDLFRSAYLDNCACQAGKGTSFAIRRFELHLRRHFSRHGCAGLCLSYDIRHFFDSIPQDKLVNFVYRKVRNPHVRALTAQVIRSYSLAEPGRGIGLGSEISQNLANAYLTPLDYVCKQRLGISGYVRYADNFLLLVPPSATLADGTTVTAREIADMCDRAVREVLGTLGLELNPKSCRISVGGTIPFLGFGFAISPSGRIDRTPLRKSYVRIRRRLKRLMRKVRSGEITPAQVWASVQAWASYRQPGDLAARRLQDQIQEELRQCR